MVIIPLHTDEYIVEFHFIKINVLIPLLEIVYGLLSLGVMVITRGLWPLVIATTPHDNNPYTFSKSGITSQYIMSYNRY